MRRKKECLTISELAELNHISTDTLRYYDKIGLFKPEYVDEFTAYRYYSFAQSEKISTILELKRLGLSLDEINQYMRSRDVESTKELLGNVRKNLKERIAELKKTEKMISKKIELLEQAKEKWEGEIRIQEMPERTVISTGEYIELLQEGIYQQLRLEALLGHRISTYATNKIGALIDPASLMDEERRALRRCAMLIVDKEDRKILRKLDPKYVKVLPAGKYLCVSGYGRFQYSSELAETIRNYVWNNKLRITGEIVEQELIDMSITDKIEENLHKIEVPIEG